MGKSPSSAFGALLLDGYDLLSAKPTSFTYKVTALINKTDGLGDRWEAHNPTGMAKVDITQIGAFFDDRAQSIHTALKTNTKAARLLTFTPLGNVIGRPHIGLEETFDTTYDVVDQVGQLVKANATYQASGQLNRGVILQHWTTKTVSWDTKTDGNAVDMTIDTGRRTFPIVSNSIANPTHVTTAVPHGLTTGELVLISGSVGSTPAINGEQVVTVLDDLHFTVPVNVTVGGTGGLLVHADSLLGGVGYLAVSDLAGITNFVGTIRHSADDVTYADLLAFDAVTAAPAAQRKTTATPAQRYLSVQGVVTGVGTIKLLVGFARKVAS